MNSHSLLFVLCLLGPTDDPLALFRQWHRSPAPDLRIQSVRSLRGQTGSESRAALLSMLDDEHHAVRAATRSVLAERPPAEALDLAGAIAALRPPRARLEGVRVILERREDPTVFALDDAPEVRARALASGRVAAPQAREALARGDPKTRALVLESLRDEALALRCARDPAEEPRIAAARVLRDPESLAPLLQDRSWRVRLAAILSAESSREAKLIPALFRVLEADAGRVRARAVAALEALTQMPFGDDLPGWREWWGRARDTFRPPEPRPPREGETTRAAITFRRIPVHSRRLCFLLDASRSMADPAPGGKGKTRWDLARRDLLAVLDRLPASAEFNVVLFRTQVEAWKPRLCPVSPASRAACRAWIEKAQPGGWTNLFDAMEVALADDDTDALYILTDGVPSSGRETGRRAILDEIAFLNRYRLVQINCVQSGSEEGLGKSWKGFLDDLANGHDGVCVRD